MKRLPCAALTALLLLPTHGAADAGRADDHAPIGVMADHRHDKGEWMFSYRAMLMTMAGNRDGTQGLAPDQLLRSGSGAYRVAPLEMTMTMHMLGVMHAPSDSITLMAMAPYYSSMRMDHATAMGGQFETAADGLGDLRFSALFPLAGDGTASLGIVAPTGRTSHRDLTPMGESVLPYPMQIGSGSWSATGSLTWNRQRASGSFGAQIRGLVRLDDNKHGYRREDRAEATAWGAWAPRPEFSLSLRAKYGAWSDIRGADPRFARALAGNLAPTVDPQLRGGQRLEAIVGLNVLLGRHRLGAEASLPLHQDLDGPQLETDHMLTFGWQYALE
ncbi:MAG: hypothetical protein OXE83_01825 [Gammaproteobacteria bacterium]|nr:hypothetical protein [Gammaproteobacteria bacterium]